AKGNAASQQHRLAKHPRPDSNPEAASQPPPEPSTSTAMEVNTPATEGETPEEPVATTSQAQQSQAARPEAPSEDDWLTASGLLLDGLLEMEYDKPFFTPIGSPDQS
ncbi:proteoglycan 4-like, partial [Aphis craccivora]